MRKQFATVQESTGACWIRYKGFIKLLFIANMQNMTKSYIISTDPDLNLFELTPEGEFFFDLC